MSNLYPAFVARNSLSSPKVRHRGAFVPPALRREDYCEYGKETHQKTCHQRDARKVECCLIRSSAREYQVGEGTKQSDNHADGDQTLGRHPQSDNKSRCTQHVGEA